MNRAAELLLGVGVVVFVLARLEAPASACGPHFPAELLSDRSATLRELGAGLFLEEVGSLVLPGDRFVVRVVEPEGAREGGGTEERALYRAGAGAYRAGRYEDAEAAFEELLALPVAERKHRSTWAAYMLGRLETDAWYDGDSEAIARYRSVRELARSGFEDDLGLAASSLGQEARIYLRRGDVAPAVQLYAEQAALGHPDAGPSLLFVVRRVVHDGAESELLATTTGQKLLAVYLRTRGGELSESQRERLRGKFAGLETVAGAGQLAAAAYRDGRWELARALARKEESTMVSQWVLGKLALRDGDREQAERHLARANALAAGDGERCRIAGERAVLALSRDEPMAAMELLWSARMEHPTDAIYVAERVLSTEELAAFVEGGRDRVGTPEEEIESWPASVRLSDLLGRRLMRDGRYSEAIPLLRAEQREAAARYALYRLIAEASPPPIPRAVAHYRASLLARQHGMEILGTTHAPDWGIWGGNYDPWAYRDDASAAAELTALERSRVDESTPVFDERFQYRYLASELAERAADDLPRRSQAFVAALCASARHVRGDLRRVRHLWRRYVREGPLVDFAATFGQECPEPDFTGAYRRVPTRAGAPSWPVYLVFVVAFAALASGGQVRRRLLATVPGPAG